MQIAAAKTLSRKLVTIRDLLRVLKLCHFTHLRLIRAQKGRSELEHAQGFSVDMADELFVSQRSLQAPRLTYRVEFETDSR
jgi:hypothetical protein